MAKLSCVYVVDGDSRLDLAVFDHYKGGVYQTRGLARSTDTKDVLVIYGSLGPGGLWARPLAEWNDLVTWPDGVLRPRFVSRGVNPTVDPPFKVK